MGVSDEFSDFISQMFDEIFSGEGWEEISLLIHSLVEVNEIDTVDLLLNIITTPPQ